MQKKTYKYVRLFLISLFLTSCTINNNNETEETSDTNIVITDNNQKTTENTGQPQTGDDQMIAMTITINNTVFLGKLYDNQAAREFSELFPLSIKMEDLHANEKFYYLANPLTVENENVGAVQKGDLMLFGNNCLVLFYEGFTTPYTYTKLGYIENADYIAEIVGYHDVEVIFSYA